MKANRSILQKAIEDRLTEYHYPNHNTPDKYNAYSGVRRTISLRLGLKNGNENLSDEQLVEAKRMLDEILPHPNKSKKEVNMNISDLAEQFENLSRVGDLGMRGDEVVVPKKLLAEAAGLLRDYNDFLDSMQRDDTNDKYKILEEVWRRDYFKYLSIIDHCREIVTLHDAKKLKSLNDSSMLPNELMDLHILLNMYHKGSYALESLRLDRFIENAVNNELPMSACNAADHDSGGCLGYSHGDDDEPVDQCKKCPNHSGYSEEDN